MINFSQLLENLLRWIFTLNTLRWALVARAGNDMCPGYCRPAFLTTSSQKQFQKFNIQEKREKKFNLISRPLRKVVQEKMAGAGWSFFFFFFFCLVEFFSFFFAGWSFFWVDFFSLFL